MYWIWANEPTAEGEALIYGAPRLVTDLGLDFDAGFQVTSTVPLIELVQDEDSQGTLTDNLIAPGVNGLLFSSRLRKLMRSVGVDNIQYLPLVLRNGLSGAETRDYHVANIIGRIACLDADRSVVETAPHDPGRIMFIESLALDENKIPTVDIFRLHEQSQVIVVSERVRRVCEDQRVTGVRFYAPADFTL